MYYTITAGTDGIGLEFPGVSGVFADSIEEARTEAAESLRRAGYALQADKGLFTVHGHRSWTLVLDAEKYADRINDARTGRSLTDATVNITAGPGSTVHVAESMTFNNLRVGD